MQHELEHALQLLQKKNYQLSIISVLRSGKEASVYKVEDQKSNTYALKVYKPHENRSFQQQADYILGKHFRERSIKRAVHKKTKLGKKLVQDNWVRREGFLLEKLNEIFANVPQIYEQVENAILIEYLGDENGAAPRLNEVKLTTEQKENFHRKILGNIELFKSIGIVHGDLSEFNILIWNNNIYIIDFPQAIDIKRNPEWEKYLERDIANINKFFKV